MERGIEKTFEPPKVVETSASEVKAGSEAPKADSKQEAATTGADAKPDDAKKDAKDELIEEDDEEFTEEDYLLKPPSNAAEAAAYAEMRARRDPAHIKRRRAQVKKAAEKLAEELSPRDEKGQLRWQDELDEADEIVQVCNFIFFSSVVLSNALLNATTGSDTGSARYSQGGPH